MKIILYIIIFLVHYNLSAQDGLIKNYFPDGKVESEINFNKNIREGEAKFYYENGNLKEERFYVNGRVEGLVRVFNENGKIKELINLENGKREGPSTLFDEEGNYLTDINYSDGKRVIPEEKIIEEPVIAKVEEEKAPDETPVKKEKKKNDNGEIAPPPLMVEDELENDPAFYMTVEVMPEPVGGFEKIQKKIKYPQEAFERGIQGEVKVMTFINEYGDVERAEVVQGLGYGCDEIARIAVYYTKFKPGLQRGKPVKVQMTIPVEFKLTEKVAN
ncbi:MAG: TonB family protein [Ignavibacteriales bacterium]|nr:MAG: TonB family protein [Ignavibacteriales bacterium]